MAFNNAFLDQHMNDSVHGRARKPGRLRDLLERDAGIAASRQNAQYGDSASDRLRALSRFCSPPGSSIVVHIVDKKGHNFMDV